MKRTVTIRIERSVWARFLERCHDVDLSPHEVAEAWLRRAIREDPEGFLRPPARPRLHELDDDDLGDLTPH